MLPIALIAGLFVSAALLFLGLRGRRVGDEPRCRKCRYNLTAAVSAKCPECGIELDRTTVCWGLRRIVAIWSVISTRRRMPASFVTPWRMRKEKQSSPAAGSCVTAETAGGGGPAGGSTGMGAPIMRVVMTAPRKISMPRGSVGPLGVWRCCTVQEFHLLRCAAVRATHAG